MIIRVQSERFTVKIGEASCGLRYAITSLPPTSVTPQQLGRMIRRHWWIENRVLYVRDLPGNLAALSNAALSIVRCQTEYEYLPEATRP